MPRYETRPVDPAQVDAVQLRGPCTLGKSKGRAGDYLVTHDDTRQEIIRGRTFEAGYELLAIGAPVAIAPRASVPRAKNGNGKGKGWKKGRQVGGTPENEAAKTAAKKLWEAGTPVKEIARTVKKTVSMIYYWSSAEKWQRPKTGAAPANAEKLSGQLK